ncbi:hypothetical protein Tco_1137887 [Tanacetum coccineum]
MAPIASSDTEVKTCSKNCLKNYEALKKQYDDLLVKLDDTGFKAATYKRGLATLEGQIVKYREHEVLFSKEIALLKRSVGSKEYQMGLLRAELEKVKQEKEGFEFKIAKFDKSAKDLEQLLGSQITDKSKKGFGYNVVPSPHPLILNRPTTLDLSYSGLEEFKEPEKRPVIPTAAKIEKPVRKPVRYAEMYRSQRPRGNQRNWNGQKSNQLGCNFVFNNKACYVCGSFDHLQYTCKHKRHVNDQKHVKPVWNNSKRVNHHYSTRITHPNSKRNMIPQAILMRSGLKTINTARSRAAVNVAKPKAVHNAVKRN